MTRRGFPHLLQPGKIGAMTLRNRLVMPPMETMYGMPDGLPSERTRDYFAARGKGGVSLITVGATGIDHHHPDTRLLEPTNAFRALDAHTLLLSFRIVLVRRKQWLSQPQPAPPC